MEKAVVSTSLGAEGLKAVHNENILVADEPDRFAECVLELLVDEEKRSHVGKAGRRLVESCYDWSIIAPQLEQAYERLHQ